MTQLAELLTPALAQLLEELPATERYRSPAELETLLERWADAGARVEQVGQSREGRPIRAAVIGGGSKTLLCWGYPHPDEPLGAEAICWLGDQALAGLLPEELADWRIVLILCADPDEATRQGWFHGARDAQTFVASCWRPTHLSWEADYGFPLDWGPFWQPIDAEGRCRTKRECLERCGRDGCRFAGFPPPPLAESLALAEAVERFDPEIVASLHSTHTGGDYTFLLERESRETLLKIAAIPEAAGSVRHLGEPIDRGRAWLREYPDLIVERNLEFFRRRLERMRWYDPQFVYGGNHSAAAFIEARGRGTQFVCPEATQFRHPDFGDRTPLDERVDAWVSIEDRPRAGRSRVVRIEVDGKLEIAHQERAPEARRAKPRKVEYQLTRGILGVQALLRRRRVLAACDRIWQQVSSLEGLEPHPYQEERARITVPGEHVNDISMLIFRTDKAYRRPPSAAQAASLRWLWPLHTATLAGNFRNFLAAQDRERIEIRRADRALERLQRTELAELPPSMRREAPREPALRSILGRVFCLMLARSGDNTRT